MSLRPCDSRWTAFPRCSQCLSASAAGCTDVPGCSIHVRRRCPTLLALQRVQCVVMAFRGGELAAGQPPHRGPQPNVKPPIAMIHLGLRHIARR